MSWRNFIDVLIEIT